MKTPSHRVLFVITAGTLLACLCSFFFWNRATAPRVIDLEVLSNLRGGATYRVFGWHNPLSDTTTWLHVVVFPDNALKAGLWFHPPATEPGDAQLLHDVARSDGAAFAINSGYFTDGFMPSGLVIDQGIQMQPASDEPVLSGFLVVSEDGGLQLIPRSAELPPCESAIQAGPFLIDPGGTIGIHSDDHRSQRRSVIATTTDRRIVLIVADAMSLYQLAKLLHERPELFGVNQIDRALNLDGGPSTALYVDLGGPFDSVPATEPVHNFVLFGER